MKVNIYKAFTLSSLLLTSFACTDLEELNTNPYNPPYVPGSSATDVNPEGIDIDYTLSATDIKGLTESESSIGALFRNLTNEGPYNDYQVTTNLTHDIYAGFLANNFKTFVERSPSYVYWDDWSKSRWDHYYNDRLASEYTQIIKICHFVNKEKYHNEFYVARIYFAFLTMMQTDTYGSIPLNYYVKGVLPPDQNVFYMPQKEVYATLFKLLDQAVENVDIQKGLNWGSSDKGTNDRCYGGDLNKWLRFANTLRLRLALRISNVDPQEAAIQGRAAIENPYGLMASNADNMRTVPKAAPTELGGEGGGGSENTYALLFEWNAQTLMSKDLELNYKGESSRLDPRCEILFWRTGNYTNNLSKGIEGTGDYVGCPTGNPDIQEAASTEEFSATKSDLNNKLGLDDNHWFSQSRELVWMSYAESRFMLAEAALRGWTNAQSAEAYYLEGIRASMNYYHIPTVKAEEYIAGLKNRSNVTGSDKEAALKEIITQKWLAIFPNGNEGWAEFRRTDYPELSNIVENNSDGEVPEGKFIKRINYPQSETNNPNRPVQLDNQGARLWWDVADTNDNNGHRVKPNNFRSGAVPNVFR